MPSPSLVGLQIVAIAFEDAGWLLCLAGELDIATVGRVRERLREVEDTSVVLDLSKVTFTDSTGLALLLAERARIRQDGAELRIRGITGQTRELLERTGVVEMFDRPT